MSTNPGFVFPPPPPPPPRASASESTYQGQAHGHSFRGGFNTRGRGRDSRGRGDGHRTSRGGHHPWDYNAARAQNASQSGNLLAQSAYGQFRTGSYPSSGLTSGNNALQHPPQHQAVGPQAHMSYGYMPQQAVQAQLPFPPPYSAPPHAQPSALGSAFPLSDNRQVTVPSGRGLPIPVHQYGQWQPSAAPNQAQLMGPPIRLGFNHNTPPITPAFPRNNHPVNYGLSVSTASQSHNISSANNNSPLNGYQSHSNQPPNPYPPNNGLSRDNGARGNEARRGQHYRPNQSFKGSRNDAPRPRAAPAVPSFLSASLPLKPDTSISSPEINSQERKKKKRKYNALGLTPRSVEHEESEDDVDEEIRLGESMGLGGAQLKFEYKGQTSVLGTPADIAAWIEERKKRFPTKQRIQEKKEAERERRLKEAKLKQELIAARKQKLSNRHKDAKKSKEEPEHGSNEDKKAEKAKRKREKIMKKLKEQQEKLEKLDAAMAGSGGLMPGTTGLIGSKRKREDEGEDDSNVQHDDKDAGGIKIKIKDIGSAELQQPHISEGTTGVKTEGVEMEDAINELIKSCQAANPMFKPTSDPVGNMNLDGSGLPARQEPGANRTAKVKHENSTSSESSSLESSDSDSDSSSSSAKPEQQSSRQQASLAPPPSSTQSKLQPRPDAPVCRQFLRTGHCPREDRPRGCHYRHVRPAARHHHQQPAPPKEKKMSQKGPGMKKERHKTKKMGLYQRMLENEKVKEDEVLLQAVKYLGDKGLLSSST